MRLNMTGIKVYKSDRTKYGVERIADRTYFTVSLTVMKTANLNIFTLKGQPIISIDLKDMKLKGSVYSLYITGLDANEGFLYEYVCDMVNVKDPYMTNKSLKRTFGVKKTETDIERAAFIPDTYDFSNDKQPLHKPFDAIMYLLHVRGFTNHSSSKVKGKGCFLGIKEKIPYLKSLNISQVALMPAYDFYEFDTEGLGLIDNHPAFIKDKTVNENGEIINNTPKEKLNYWGYKEANYFCVKPEYAYSPDASKEFKDMVFALHNEGIELIMQMYFPSHIPHALIVDCLRFWHITYHVDGFHVMGENIPVKLIISDDILCDAKLYFNNIYIDSNDLISSKNRYVTDVNTGFMVSARRFLKSDSGSLCDFASSQRANPSMPYRLNYITCHEGFTLNDLVSYELKHNESNGENNSDGTNDNFSWNCGAEGKSLKKAIKDLRIRQMKNALTMLFTSQSAPMLFMGDEFMNSQDGNNNPYCQDNETTWLNWKLNKSSEELLDFTRELTALRAKHKVLRQEGELKNMDYLKCGSPDISYHQDMAWRANLNNNLLHIGIMLDGNYAGFGNKADDTFYIAYNMYWENRVFGLPRLKNNMRWQLLMSTCSDEENKEIKKDLLESNDEVCVLKRSIMILRAAHVKGAVKKEEEMK